MSLNCKEDVQVVASFASRSSLTHSIPRENFLSDSVNNQSQRASWLCHLRAALGYSTLVGRKKRSSTATPSQTTAPRHVRSTTGRPRKRPREMGQEGSQISPPWAASVTGLENRTISRIAPSKTSRHFGQHGVSATVTSFHNLDVSSATFTA